MYNPRWFREERVDILRNEVDKISFGTLVTLGKSGVMASHVPMLIDRSRGELGILYGHVARGNTQWRDSLPGGEGLAMFLGPDAYISPSWYATKKETGMVVPTWNYIAIHIRGPVTFFQETGRIREIVTKLTRHHEVDSKLPWEVTDAPAEYLDRELRSIIGFEMPIVGIEGKWKLSQNRPEADKGSVIAQLGVRDKLRDKEIAREMKGRI